MLFRLLHPPFVFEIPDEWWVAAGATGFTPTSQSYLCTTEANEVILKLDEIAPPLRQPKVIQDHHHGFRRQGAIDAGRGGMVDVLRAIVSDIRLPPVNVRRVRGISAEGFCYVVQAGFHRFYASYALGFSHLPCLLGADWQPEGQFGDEW